MVGSCDYYSVNFKGLYILLPAAQPKVLFDFQQLITVSSEFKNSVD